MTSFALLLNRDPDGLAHAVAARLITRLVDVQSTGKVAQVVLTGGRVASAVYRAVAESPARTAIDWQRVEFWWGDERFLPDGDPERNETQARDALLSKVDVDPAKVHPMAADTGQGPEAAAAAYAEELSAAAGAARTEGAPRAASVSGAGSAEGELSAAATSRAEGADSGAGRADAEVRVPVFDLLMLGVGPDGHVASLFPDHPELAVDDRSAVAVHDSPKPPPTRISLTFPALARAEEVWFVVAGEDKADAVNQALTGDTVPASRPEGLSRTLWLLDDAAAAQLADDTRSPRA
ncbi:6-phosphogluconolactonase [Kribbella flavida DSM 17836]|uniref:6-phosphogluconolactonase n=1 Tax=Kribbella flavida (strain DSM 17836 / JCM 10339 / NBRC 14399) TaxID=479435 RepID=D2Q4L4_KRIFD|nr:6-phosphogluconolactonase [Kribbella flavida]ADB32328.1 6-phosphogluconolactonase [Kribbella flavida DSM 17836]